MNDKVGHNYRHSRYFKDNAGELTSLFNGLDLFGCKQKWTSLFLTLALQRYSEKYSISCQWKKSSASSTTFLVS